MSCHSDFHSWFLLFAVLDPILEKKQLLYIIEERCILSIDFRSVRML